MLPPTRKQAKMRGLSEDTIELPPRFLPGSVDEPHHYQKTTSRRRIDKTLPVNEHKKSRHGLDGYESATTIRRIESRNPFVPTYRIEVPLYHYCARCGSRRSKTFQREHPMGPGDTPITGICRRCRKAEATKPVPNPPPAKPAKPVKPAEPAGEMEVEEIIIRRGKGQSPFRRIIVPSGAAAQYTRRKVSSSDEEEECPPTTRTVPTPNTPRILRRVTSLSSPKRVIMPRYRRERSSSNERVMVFHSTREADRENEEGYEMPRNEFSENQRVKVRHSSPPRITRKDEPLVRRKIRVSLSSEEYQKEDNDVLDRKSRLDARDRIDACPGSWGYRVVTRVEPRRIPEEIPKVVKKSRDSSPEWYYKQYRRYKEPSKDNVDEVLVANDSLPTVRKSSSRRRKRSPPPEHLHRPGILRSSRDDQPKDLYDAEYRVYDPTRRPIVHEGPVIREKHRVRFTPSTAGASAARSQREAYGDWKEEQRDQRVYNHAKSHIGQTIHEKGAGPLDLDGHASEDPRASDSSADELSSYEYLTTYPELKPATFSPEFNEDRKHEMPDSARSKSSALPESSSRVPSGSYRIRSLTCTKSRTSYSPIHPPTKAVRTPISKSSSSKNQRGRQSDIISSGRQPHVPLRMQALTADPIVPESHRRTPDTPLLDQNGRQRSLTLNNHYSNDIFTTATIMDGDGEWRTGTWEAEAHVTRREPPWTGTFVLRSKPIDDDDLVHAQRDEQVLGKGKARK